MNEVVSKLDDFGTPAWIALMVLSFIVWWPLGLAMLAFLLWSGRMGHEWGCRSFDNRWRERMEQRRERWGGGGRGHTSSGNRAFDEYREETLKRLEEEQREFREFLERLRLAKDRSEFDQFMTERKNRPSPGSDEQKPAPQS